MIFCDNYTKFLKDLEKQGKFIYSEGVPALRSRFNLSKKDAVVILDRYLRDKSTRKKNLTEGYRIKNAIGSYVGIFYSINGKLYFMKESLDDIIDKEGYQEVYNCSYNHFDMWYDYLAKKYPKLNDIDYDYYARGRVCYNSSLGKHIIYLDEKISDDIFIDEIVKELSIPDWEVRTDIHYQSVLI